MNVLLICSSAITTNILAAKLQKYAAENSKPDCFSAGRIGQYRELLPHADVVLIAPQAALMANPLKEEAAQLDIPCQVLSEPTFALADVEKIYAYLETCRAVPKAAPVPVPLSIALMGRILLDAALYSAPVLVFGLFCLIPGKLFSSPILLEASQATLSILVLYFMFSVGYQYGNHTHREPVSRGLIALGAPLLMLPIGNLVETWNAAFRVVHGQIPLSFFAFPNALFLIILTLAAVVLLYRLDKIRLPASVAVVPMMESMIKMGVIAVLFILFRLLLSFL